MAEREVRDMSDIEFLESWFNKVKKEKGIETAIEYLQIKERQKYNYYCYEVSKN